jgi:plasmid stabilization system protein ParE
MTTKPQTYAVTVSALALHQMEEACAYIHGHGAPLAAQRMAVRFLAAIETLEHHPERGRPVSRGLYELLTVRPYVIRYRIGPGAVEVVRIWHAAQRPG